MRLVDMHAERSGQTSRRTPRGARGDAGCERAGGFLLVTTSPSRHASHAAAAAAAEAPSWNEGPHFRATVSSNIPPHSPTTVPCCCYTLLPC